MTEQLLDATAKVALEAMAEAHDLKKWDRVVEVGDAWLAARNDELPLLPALFYAQSLMGVGRYPDAVRWAGQVARAMPKKDMVPYVACLATYGQALCRVGQFPLARRTLKHMAMQQCDHPEAVEKIGHVHLAVTQKWKEGWKLHESRLAQPGRAFPPHTVAWDGVTKEPVAVLHEQGIGDAVLFARWIPWLAEVTGHPVKWFGPKLLARWMSGICELGTEEDEARARESGTPIVSVWSMSLPHVAGCTSPLKVPPPVAPAELVAKRRYLEYERSHRDAVRIGVCWKGASHGWHDFERSLTPEEFRPVIEPIPGVVFVNLTHDADVPEGYPVARVKYGDLWETADTIASCDLVVSVDTSVVHVAGSLRVPTLVITPTVPDWRYEWPYGSGTPFYGSVTVCRRKFGNDLSVVTKARALVERFAAKVKEKVA